MALCGSGIASITVKWFVPGMASKRVCAPALPQVSAMTRLWRRNSLEFQASGHRVEYAALGRRPEQR